MEIKTERCARAKQHYSSQSVTGGKQAIGVGGGSDRPGVINKKSWQIQQKSKMTEEYKLKKKLYDRERRRGLVNIGEAFQRCRNLRDFKGMETDEGSWVMWALRFRRLLFSTGQFNLAPKSSSIEPPQGAAQPSASWEIFWLSGTCFLLDSKYVTFLTELL